MIKIRTSEWGFILLIPWIILITIITIKHPWFLLGFLAGIGVMIGIKISW